MPATASSTRVVKQLGPTQPGALRWARRYADALVCVRYRVDTARRRRYTTVELIVDDAPVGARSRAGDAIVAVRIGFSETALRQQAKEGGARWDARGKLWRLTREQAKALKLLDRVVPE